VKYRTVSIPTETLSAVITGCGGKVTTCSRRSSSGRTRSMKGTTIGHARGQRAAVAAEALDDARPRLRDDPHGPGGDEQREQDQHCRHDQTDHPCLLSRRRARWRPDLITCTRVPASSTLSSS
jgi:hypothetical protein